VEVVIERRQEARNVGFEWTNRAGACGLSARSPELRSHGRYGRIRHGPCGFDNALSAGRRLLLDPTSLRR